MNRLPSLWRAVRQSSCIAASKALLATFVTGLLVLQAAFLECNAEAQANDSQQQNAQSQTPSPPQTSSKQAVLKRHRFDCKHPADPHRRHVGCKDEHFDWDDTLSKSWNGMRAVVKDLGITPTLSYTGVLQTNVKGGPHQIWSYAGQLTGGLDISLEKSLKIPGMSVYLGGSWGTGDDLSGFLHTLFPVNGLYAPSYYLGEMYLQETLLDKRLTLAGGRLGPANSFAALQIFANYVNYGINPNPYSLGANDISFFSPPVGTEWGALATYDFTRLIRVSGGVFNTNPRSANGLDHGTDFALQEGNKGALVAGQISLFPHEIKDEGRQGEYTVGFLINNNPIPGPTGIAANSGYWGIFAQGQEMVYQPDGPGTERGLTIWASAAYNSKPALSPIPLFWGAGASYQGLIPARKNDVISAGWIYGRLSDSVPNANAEHVLEVNYNFRCSRYLSLTPDFQYVWKPGGFDVSGAAVVGMQAAVTF